MEGRPLLAGRYELLEQLGGSTWRALDTRLGREVVVRSGEVAGATLSHGSIGRVFDEGELEGERYAVLEYLPGGTLAERGELTPEAAGDVAAALAYAHSEGVVHGALDAEAIRFDPVGRAKVTGFTGRGDPAADLAALDALRREYASTAVVPPPVEEATLIQRPEPAPRRRWGLIAAALAALTLAAAGIAAAVLASDDDPPVDRTTARTDPISSATTATEEEEPAPPPPTTTEETTTATTDTTQPTTTEPPPPPTTAEPPATTAEPPPTVEPTLPIEPTLPPLPTEPPLTTEPLLPTVTGG